jgi:hypothetical protein
MSEADRKSWLLIGVLFLTNFFVIGCSSAITGVFLTPLGDCAHHRGPGQIVPRVRTGRRTQTGID